MTGRDDDATHSMSEPPSPGGALGSSPRIERYRVEAVLGTGGMGEVVRARDPELGRRVAIKRIRTPGPIPPGLEARFVEEAQITAQLDHPHVVPIHELGRDSDGRPYYAMKEIRGRSLKAVLDEGRLPLPALLRIFVKVCDAIAFAHSRGVIHRDLKPANVMVGDFGEVFVVDWGVAKVLARKSPGPAGVEDEVRTVRSEDEALATRPDAIVGTLAYASPEQATAEGPADERVDVYLLGGILYHVLTGAPPHRVAKGTDRLAVVAMIAARPVEPARSRAPDRSIPPELEAIAARALERDPALRYPGVAALRSDVEAWLDGRLVSAARYHPLAVLRKWALRHRSLVGALLAAFLTAGAFGVDRILEAAARERERRDAVAAARERVAGLDPDALRAVARAYLAAVPDDPLARTPMSPAQGERAASVLGRLRDLSDAQAERLRLEPGDAGTRQDLRETLLMSGRLAEAAEDFTLAEFAFGRAAALDPADTEARLRLEGVARARGARLARRRRRIEAILEDAAAGRLRRDLDAGRSYDAARIELAGYRERQTVDLLLATLDTLTGRIREAARAEFLAAIEGRAPPGTDAAVLAWFETLVPEPAGGAGAPLRALEEQKRLDAARSLLEEPGPGEERRVVERVLAEAQRRVLAAEGRDGETLLALACETLGRLGDPRGSVAALARYLWSEFDELRAIPAGFALVDLSASDPGARLVLDALVGLREGQEGPGRFDVRGAFWRRVGRELRRTLASTGPGSGGTAIDRVRRAARYEAEGDREAAIAELGRAIESDPDLAEALLARGSLWIEEGRPDRALDDFEREIALDPDSAAAHAGRAEAKQRAGEPAAALEDYSRAIELDPEAAATWWKRASARLETGDLAGAIADCDWAIRIDPGDARAHLHRAAAHRRSGDLAAARADLDCALELDPGFVPARIARGELHRDRRDLDAAIVDFTKALEEDPRSLAALLGRALTHAELAQWQRSLDDLDRAMGVDPGNAAARHHRAVVRYRLGDRAGARADLDRAIKLDPRLGPAWALRGRLRRESGDLAGAIDDLTSAVEREPRNTEFLYELLDLEIERDPGNARVWMRRGDTREVLGDAAGARSDYDRAIELDPRDPLAWFGRAIARRKLGDLDGSLADYDRALELEPSFTVAWNNRALVRLERGDLEGARTDYERSLELDADSWAAWVGYSEVLEALGRRDQALVALRRCLELAPPAFRGAIRERIETLERD